MLDFSFLNQWRNKWKNIVSMATWHHGLHTPQSWFLPQMDKEWKTFRVCVCVCLSTQLGTQVCEKENTGDCENVKLWQNWSATPQSLLKSSKRADDLWQCPPRRHPGSVAASNQPGPCGSGAWTLTSLWCKPGNSMSENFLHGIFFTLKWFLLQFLKPTEKHFGNLIKLRLYKKTAYACLCLTRDACF